MKSTEKIFSDGYEFVFPEAAMDACRCANEKIMTGEY